MASTITWTEAHQLGTILPEIMSHSYVRFKRDADDSIREGTLRYLTSDPLDDDLPRGDENNILSQYVRITMRTGMEWFLPLAELMPLPSNGCMAFGKD